MMRFVKALSLLVIAAPVAAMSPAAADEGVIASGVVYGGAAQKRVVCYFTNQGGGNVKISSVSVFDAGGGDVAPAIDSCGEAAIVLAGGKSCERAANIANNAVYGCRAKVSDLTNVRGTVEIRDQNQNVLNSLPMK